MGHSLIDRLSEELGWPRLTDEAHVAGFIKRPGPHVIFLPGDPQRNLESADVAVILPELHRAFQGRFDCAVADDAVERAVKEGSKVYKTPALIFYRDGVCLGGIAKVRDWSDYVDRITRLIDTPRAVA